MNDEYVLEMLDIQKDFPGVKALQNVSLQVRNAEIHGLVGENGAGKSTLMKILAGLYSHDAGEIKFEGKIQSNLTPRSIEKMGIHFIHQERFVVPFLTVAESLFLGIEPTYSPFKLMNRKLLEKEAEKILRENVGFEVSGKKLIGDLTVGEQQLVQICRSLLHDPKIIVFDEPTAVLAKSEADRLFEIIRELGKKIAIIYISHYFGEILDLCDRVTVLRNGQNVDTVNAEGMTIESLVLMMVGRNISEQYPPKNKEIGEVLMDVKGLTHEKFFQNVDFNIRRGEVVGFTGLMGSGHSHIGTAVYDTAGITSGSIEFNNQPVNRNNHIKAVKLGMGYVPEDRRALGVIQKMSVKENTTLACMEKVSSKGVIRKELENNLVDDLIKKLGVKTPDREAATGFLSGGNQQKVVLAKWLGSDSTLFILNQPTSGVDIGARAEIYALIKKLTEQGAGVLLISQDIQELVGLSHRVYVMYRGEVKLEMDADEDITDKVIVSMMGGERE